MKFVKIIERKLMEVSVLYLAVVAAMAFGVHKLATAWALAERGYEAVGGEVFLVPVFLVLSYFFYAKVIAPHYYKKIEKAQDIMRELHTSRAIKAIAMFDKNGKLEGVFYKTSSGNIRYRKSRPQVVRVMDGVEVTNDTSKKVV